MSTTKKQAKHFDLLVIGGGSGGMAGARRAAQYGAKVALIESSMALGGTCVNVGCVPKKIMYNTATVNETLHGARHYGYHVSEHTFDWAKIKELRDNYVKRLNGIYDKNLKNAGITLITGTAAFVGPKRVQVGNQEYSGDHVLIAVGGYPTMPDIPGIEHCINSNGFFDLESQPERVAVVGAGYIAVELAGIFNALGSNTHLFCRKEMTLRTFDVMLKTKLDEEMRKGGMHMHPHSTPKAVVMDPKTKKLTLETEEGGVHPEFDVILMAIGRAPNVQPLNLEAAGVEVDERKGHIKVDDYQNTSAAGIYSVGDVNGLVELTPMAIAAGRRLADRLFGGMPEAKADYTMVPTVVFSHPPIATCGDTEEAAAAKYGADNLKIYTSTFTNLYFGHWPMPPEEKQKTAMKLICHGENEKVIGLHVLGMGADEMMQGFGVAMKMGATKADFDNCVAIHPTAAEEVVTLAPWGLSGKSKAN